MNAILVFTILIAYYILTIILLIGAWILSTMISGYLGLTGFNWWAVTLLLLFILMGAYGRGATDTITEISNKTKKGIEEY